MSRRRKQNTNIQKVIQKLYREFWKLAVSFTNSLLDWLLRGLLVTRTQQRRQTAKAGFILPTVTMLLLVVALVIGAILFRTGSRTNQVITQRDQQVIYNAATPAIDRARAKLEYLFTKEEQRLPLGTPPENTLLEIMLNEREPRPANGANPYNLPNEEQLDLDGDGKKDLAWSYEDRDRNGQPVTIAYSILLKSEVRSGSTLIIDLTDNNPKEKAKKLVVRNGPIKTNDSTQPLCANLNLSPEQGWYPATSGTLRKTFQINAVVISNPNSAARKITTLELQQDRQVDKGNKWGAWFRYDLELYPGVDFRWNGSMHTEGNLMIRPSGDPTDPGFPSITGYLISSPSSCLYAKDAAEVTVTRRDRNERTGQPEFRGIVVSGTVRDNNEGPQSTFHLFGPDREISGSRVILDPSKDSNISKSPGNLAIDPVALYTRDVSRARGGDETNADTFDTGWNGRSFASDQRIFNQFQPTPFVDDTYRADDRLGPKPQYDRGNILVDAANRNGVNISSSGLSGDQKDKLTRNAPIPGDTNFQTLGLDGYWERRARFEGLRVIVGERLELGNNNGWATDLNADGDRLDPGETPDPLYPPAQNPILHEQQQRRTLRDNLAAVQGAAVYHYTQDNGNSPVACVATTAHAGTQFAKDQSKNFDTSNGQLGTNFFSGKGTNGWEYEVPPPGLGGSWDTALNNLARFAGEVDGAFPPTKQDRVYPSPYLSMWGNFSNLRRAMENNNSSIADSSYKQTAACTMGILADNLETIRERVEANPITPDVITWSTALMNPPPAPNPPLTPNSTAEEYIRLLPTPEAQNKARNFSLWEQIKRDREFGFVPVPIATAAAPYAKYQYEVKQQPSGYTFSGITYTSESTVNATTQITNPNTRRFLAFSCDVSSKFGIDVSNPSGEQQFLRLAASLCGDGRPKFPSLYYLFPTGTPVTQPTNEPYVSPPAPYPAPSAPAGTLDPAAIRLKPRSAVGYGSGSSWRLPSPQGTGTANQYTIRVNGSNYFVPFLDSAFYDGREAMTVRALNMDLGLLRTNVSGSSETWLPAGGVVYAFREDAKREDSISRPASGANPTDARNPASPTDPALESNLISRKPVDFKPDPDRRPYGFRLINGRNLTRGDNNPRGMTFISDNSVYIQGDFNLHGDDNDIEEFTDRLNQPSWGNFYTRSTLNDRFARIGSGRDPWRPTEILSDAITILSNNFNEGRIDFGIRNTNGTIGNHSFRGMNRPSDAGRTWVREDNSTINDDTSTVPIKISRNGHPIYCASGSNPCPLSDQREYDGSYEPFTTNHRDIINAAQRTRVNAVLVSGIVPSRANQGNGGLHNFPRLLEKWAGVDLQIAGSFIQLNFSTSATGLFDQDGWEPGVDPAGGENVYYYQPPNRLWGYDVGLQYAPAGPLAQRLTTPKGIRSEFYQELPSNDPYICLLRKRINQDTLAQQECPN